MKTLEKLQIILIILAAILLLVGILSKLLIIPIGMQLVQVGGLHRLANTMLLFSIGLGVYIIVGKKK